MTHISTNESAHDTAKVIDASKDGMASKTFDASVSSTGQGLNGFAGTPIYRGSSKAAKIIADE